LRFPAISRTCLHLRKDVAIAAKERIRLHQGYGGQKEHEGKSFRALSSLCAFVAGSFLAFSGLAGPTCLARALATAEGLAKAGTRGTFKEQARERHTDSILPRFYGNAKYIFT
jgi:hypothetical protein